MLFFFKAIVAWRKFIIIATLVTAGIIAVVSLLLPKWYTASAAIFPPDQKGSMPLYSDLIQSMQMPLLGQLGRGARPETIYIDMMKSRNIGMRLVEEFDLYEQYGASLPEEALYALHSHTNFTFLENGLISVGVEDRNPQRAADMANRYVSLLDEFNRGLNITRASKTKEFIGRQLVVRREQLAKSELELRKFQEENKALDLEEQLQSAMLIITELTSEAIALETELRILENYASPTSDEYGQKKQEYEQVLGQLKKLKLSDAGNDEDLVRAYIPTLEDVPEIALQLIRLKRNVEIETAVYSMLVKEFEKSRIEEARDTPTVQVMDPATAPSLRSRPRRKAMVVIGALAGLGWSVFLSVLVVAWRENREQSRVISEVLDPVISDFSKVFRRR